MKLEQLQDLSWSLQLSEEGTRVQLLEKVEEALKARRAELSLTPRYAGVYKSLDRVRKRKRNTTNEQTQLESTENPLPSISGNPLASLLHAGLPIDPSLL